MQPWKTPSERKPWRPARDAAVVGWMARWQIAQKLRRFLWKMDLAEILHHDEPELFWCLLHKNDKGRVVGGLLPIKRAAEISRTYPVAGKTYPAGVCQDDMAVQADELMDVHAWEADSREFDLEELIGGGH